MSKRHNKILGGLIIGIAALLMVACLPVHERTIYTCLHCRAQRTDHSLFGVPWQKERETSFTAWYLIRHPAHEHTWLPASCQRGDNLFGQVVSWGCYRLHSVALLSPQTQLDFAQSANAATLEHFFRGIDSRD